MEKKQIYGLIGHPVKHSLSAAMHNAAFAHLGIDAEYQLFDVLPENLEDFFNRDVLEKDIKGFNVTIPHKENAVSFLTNNNKLVQKIGATNTIIVDDDEKFKGYNTDCMGFLKHLKELEIAVRGKKAGIIGSGGAAKAVVYALMSLNINEIMIYDKDSEKSKQLISRMVQQLAPGANISVVDSIESLGIKNKDILINATPIGMKEQDPLLVTKDMLHQDLFVYDLIYNPEKTKLLELADSLGIKNSNGFKMLLYQGTLAFEHWTGQSAPEDVMFEALQKALDN